MVQWIKDLERELDKPGSASYIKLRELKENKFQGNLRINFNAGRIASFNLYDTISVK